MLKHQIFHDKGISSTKINRLVSDKLLYFLCDGSEIGLAAHTFSAKHGRHYFRIVLLADQITVIGN